MIIIPSLSESLRKRGEEEQKEEAGLQEMRWGGGWLLRDGPPPVPRSSKDRTSELATALVQSSRHALSAYFGERPLEAPPKQAEEGQSWPEQSSPTSDTPQQRTPPHESPPSRHLTFAPCRWLEILLIRSGKRDSPLPSPFSPPPKVHKQVSHRQQ